ncbi:magnesium/cobalt transporter CorA [Petrotoga olearia]|uniref:Magnesium transport protein CorA n=2 Tax=Petrotoga olearia TaxID=156203 RepID=A0A2K1P0T4_9BACT|nr:magnesium/cobalt transporter CorA [Petrotoga olearia]PNR96391.1 magnesium transporter [Petrotoga olearia DSM 13574]RMA76550.1 magnesium transporter [Petrotoga olearia]
MNLGKQKNSSKVGTPPGELIYTGKLEPSKAIINVVSYDQHTYNIRENVDPDFLKTLDKNKIHWIDFENVSDPDKLTSIGEIFNIHKLTMEDIINVNQRTKIEFYDSYTFLVLKIISDSNEKLEFRQFSMIIKENILISFSEEKNFATKWLKTQLESNAGDIRNKDLGYLTFSLMDIVVDSYFSKLSNYISYTQEIDEKITEDIEEELFIKIKKIKQEILRFRRFVAPLKDILFQMQKKEKGIVNEKNQIYFNDLYDHTIRISESIDLLRENLNNLTEIYLSIASNRLNEIMRILTIISTIFIPLTFIAGIYGMNFENMPELHWRFGYFLILGIMATIAVIMIIIFKKKKWF